MSVHSDGIISLPRVCVSISRTTSSLREIFPYQPISVPHQSFMLRSIVVQYVALASLSNKYPEYDAALGAIVSARINGVNAMSVEDAK